MTTTPDNYPNTPEEELEPETFTGAVPDAPPADTDATDHIEGDRKPEADDGTEGNGNDDFSFG